MTTCCLCNEQAWLECRDTAYNFDVLCIERLHLMLSVDLTLLTDMIALVESYHLAKQHIVQTIQDCHQYCNMECQCCGHTVTDMDTSQHEFILSAVTDYYIALNETQSKILNRLTNCIDEMRAIDQMVGMDGIKSEFVRLLKFLATIEPDELSANSFLMHMVIMGPPGHGKTEIAKLLGNAFRKSGLLSSDKFVLATRANLIGKYCGHTARETTEMFDKARGGVIFIDEVYALGNPEKKDVFTGECINTINQLLSERTDTLCIIAGYEKEIDTCFFSYNPGLERRFPWRFRIKTYSEEDLVKIFYKKLEDTGRIADPDALLPSDIKKHLDKFPNAGGDMVNLVTNCMLAYYENSFLQGCIGRAMNRQDVITGLQRYLANRKVEEKSLPPPGMYT